VAKEFQQIEWDAAIEEDCRQVVRLAIREDLGRVFDWTTLCLVPGDLPARAAVVAREPGVVAGLPAVQLAVAEMDNAIRVHSLATDGDAIAPGQALCDVEGPARSLLVAERILLNFIGHLSGIATQTAKYVQAVAGTQARIYDTRKTTPGWRRLEKYAVRCGGGHNHRTGLFDAILIKDNHLAVLGRQRLSPADAVRKAREFVSTMAATQKKPEMIVEVEVDTLGQLDDVLRAGPDLVLLDNMSTADLREAVGRRDAVGAEIELEASGGVTLENIAAIAATGVERISVGALTHSARHLDVGLDWK
jgi:nicotinate-nucleotide pyrophosphorylase (carboxylating)